MRPRTFVLHAAAWMAAFSVAYRYPYAPGGTLVALRDGYLRVVARAAGTVVGMFDTHAVTIDRVIRGRFALRIDPGCAALELQALVVAAVLAFPASRAEKLVGLVGSVLALTVVNQLRIASLYLVGMHAPARFDMLHERLFPALLLSLAVAGFFLWTRWAERDAWHAPARMRSTG